jgi:hypothetical protein
MANFGFSSSPAKNAVFTSIEAMQLREGILSTSR